MGTGRMSWAGSGYSDRPTKAPTLQKGGGDLILTDTYMGVALRTDASMAANSGSISTLLPLR